MTASFESAFPKLSDEEMLSLEKFASCEDFADGDVVFHSGQPDMDLFVVKKGGLEILNPSDDNESIIVHYAGHFSGDIDLLTRRPTIVTGRAKGETQLLRVKNSELRDVLRRIPRLSEKMLVAVQSRRELLSGLGRLGLKVVGHAQCRDTTMIREFLYKNFVPFRFFDVETGDGKAQFETMGSPALLPVVECFNGTVLTKPSLRDIADGAGIWKHCPNQEVDFAIIGAGPAGIAAAVYAASEGLSTLVLDRLGPGGQAGGSSKIENFIGFPSGLSGNELATRGSLQMLKFGAEMVAPVDVKSITRSANGNSHDLKLDCGAVVTARVVLVAAGVQWKKLEARNAERYERAGVYYACTQVEATLHEDTDVAVVGAGNSAGQAAMFLAECCAKRNVHLIVRSNFGPSMSDYLSDRIRVMSNIVVHEQSSIEVVNGGMHIESVDVISKSEGRFTLPVAAIFVFIGSEPSHPWLPAEIKRDDKGFLLTGTDALTSGAWPLKDRSPCPLETTVPGILAAGDIRSGSTKRVGFAVGDGSQAVTCVHSLMQLMPAKVRS
jgi:thioredoxin reductase (NADPH)